jgi:hypothetical protein
MSASRTRYDLLVPTRCLAAALGSLALAAATECRAVTKYTNLDDCRASNGRTCACSAASPTGGHCVEWEGQKITNMGGGHWGFDDLPLADGGSISGSFASASGSPVLEAINLLSTTGGAVDGTSYSYAEVIGQDLSQIAFYDAPHGSRDTGRVLLVTLARPIVGDEPIEVLALREGLCDGAECQSDSLLRTARGVGADGDYNGDGVVNSADYTVWRDSLGGADPLRLADGDSNGVVDAGDYDHWASAYGRVTMNPITTMNPIAAAVPEPCGLALVGLVLASLSGRARGHAKR